jgi:hypothetical protein
LILICLQRSDLGLNFSPLNISCFLISSDKTWSYRDLVTNLQNTLQDCSTSDTTFKILGLLSWLVDIEGSNDNHLRWWYEISYRQRNSAEIVNNSLNIVLQLSRNGNNWSSFSNCSIDELPDIALLSNATSRIFNNNIYFVLNDNDLI